MALLPRPPAVCSAPGERLQARLASGDKAGLSEGVTGLKAGPARTGVRELTYRLVFIASGTQVGGSWSRRGLCQGGITAAARSGRPAPLGGQRRAALPTPPLAPTSRQACIQ